MRFSFPDSCCVVLHEAPPSDETPPLSHLQPWPSLTALDHFKDESTGLEHSRTSCTSSHLVLIPFFVKFDHEKQCPSLEIYFMSTSGRDEYLLDLHFIFLVQSYKAIEPL